MPLKLSLLPGKFAVCRLEPDAAIPPWATNGRFISITRTADELSVVCPQSNVPGHILSEDEWACLKVEGPLDFSLTGILASLTQPLAQAGISIFAVSTYDTDYLLVKQQVVAQAINTLAQQGHSISR